MVIWVKISHNEIMMVIYWKCIIRAIDKVAPDNRLKLKKFIRMMQICLCKQK